MAVPSTFPLHGITLHVAPHSARPHDDSRMTPREIGHVTKLLNRGKCFIHEVQHCEQCYYMELQKRQQEETALRNAKRGKAAPGQCIQNASVNFD